MATTAKPWDNGALQASANGRHIQHANGDAFHWQADTCWELFHRLTREEITLLVETRARQDFNVLQVVALAELEGIRVPNRYGARPLKDENPETPDLDGGYWDLVDFAFDVAADHGIYLALLPTWGDKLTRAWGAGPVIFNETNIEAYGRWIASRYGSRQNLIWVNGGDRDTAGYEDAWRGLAHGLRAGAAERHLMTFHPMGELSSGESFHAEAWLDLNMLQTGHGHPELERIRKMITANWQRTPAKPVLDGEPRYENHPIQFDARKGYFQAGDVRQAIYAGLLSGGCGFTYGCHAIWQFAQDAYEPINNPISHWKYSLELPGANQVQFATKLMREENVLELLPDLSILEDRSALFARVSENRTRAVVYFPESHRVRLNAKFSTVRWFDPRTGETHEAQPVDTHLEPPKSDAQTRDWVAILSA